MFFTKDKRRIWKQIGFLEESIDNLNERIDGITYDVESLENELKELKENKTREIDDEEHSRKAKILNDIKAVQDYSLEDVLNYYMKG